MKTAFISTGKVRSRKPSLPHKLRIQHMIYNTNARIVCKNSTAVVYIG